MLELSSNNFESEVMNSPIPVLVDFWASWCGPCRIQGPIIEALAEEYKDKAVKIAKVNVDDNQSLAEMYSIFSIPTLVLFYKGAIHARLVGVQKRERLAEKLDALIGT